MTIVILNNFCVINVKKRSICFIFIYDITHDYAYNRIIQIQKTSQVD